MPKGILIVIGPGRNQKFKGGIMNSRADMMADGADGTADGGDGMDGDGMDGMDGMHGKYDNKACVPLESIASGGTPPSVGDKVNFSIEGEVYNVTGDQAMINVRAVDGESVDSFDGTGAVDDGGGMSGMNPNKGESLANMGARLRAKGEQY